MRNGLSFWVWLQKLIYFWVKSKILPAHPVEELGIDTNKPICFVMKTNSLADLLVLDHHCRDLNLPLPYLKPQSLGSRTRWSSYIYLLGLELLTINRAAHKRPPSPVLDLLKKAEKEPEFDVQLIPVSVFWGRKPGSEEKSFWELLFADDDRASIFRKIFIVIFQGRSVFIDFSKPIMLRDQLNEQSNAEQTARKITRVLRVHFTAKRTKVLGPSLPRRARVLETIIRTKAMTAAIEEESRKKNISIQRAEETARRYISEIAADILPSFISAGEMVLKWLWNKIYEGVEVLHGSRLRAIPTQNTIVYVPCHRSHMDYLLINYCLFFEGVSTCHIAAGINLNFWPVGPFIRRCGAFFIRRSFSNNRLYTTSFTEYVHFLLSRGVPVKFFAEGGRSRTGKLLPPKTGMLAMVVHSFLRLRDKQITIVPVYVGYDKIAEVATYRRELTGEEKTKEGVWMMLKGTRRALSSSHGKAYVAFGEPLDLKSYIDEHHPNWQSEASTYDTKPTWMSGLVGQLAHNIMGRINQTTVLSPVGLVSLVLLASRQKALSEEDFTDYLKLFRDLLVKTPYSPDITVSKMDPKEMIRYAERLAGLKRFNYPGGDVIYVQEPHSSYIIYYRNTVAHLFVIPSLVAAFLMHNDSYSEQDLMESCSVIYPILEKEFTLAYSKESLPDYVRTSIDAMAQMQLIHRDGKGNITRSSMASKEFAALRVLGWVIGPSIERYAIAVSLLWNQKAKSSFKVDDFQKECVLMAQRISLLTGVGDAELPTPQLVKTIIEQLKGLHYIKATSETEFVLESSFSEVYKLASSLLSSDIRQSISRMEQK